MATFFQPAPAHSLQILKHPQDRGCCQAVRRAVCTRTYEETSLEEAQPDVNASVRKGVLKTCIDLYGYSRMTGSKRCCGVFVHHYGS